MKLGIMAKNNTYRKEFIGARKGVSFLNREIRVKEILKYKNSGKLLDIGCALGFFLRFAENYFETYGIDISSLAIKKAKTITPNSKLFVQDAQLKYPFKDNFFDIVTSYDVIEHLSNPYGSLKESFRVLKTSGYLFLQTPTDKSQKIIIDNTHISLFSKSRLVYILKKIGFNIVLFEKRRSILYFDRFARKFINFFTKDNTVIALDNYNSIAPQLLKSSKAKLFILRKLKLIIWEFDKFISKFTLAPEMFIVAQKPRV